MSKNESKHTKTLRARLFFITISQSPLNTHQEVEDLLLKNEQFLSTYLISRENHTDGTYHFHIFLKYSKLREFSYKHFDYFGQHPNIQKVRHPKDVISYILKEDLQPLFNSDFLSYSLKKAPLASVSLLINKQIDFYQALLSYPVVADNITKYKKLFFEYEVAKRHAKQLAKKPLQSLSNLPSVFQPIIDCLEQMNKFGYQRPQKTPNLLLFSKNPNKGKTTFLNLLSKHYPTFSFPTDGWFDGYKNNFYKLISWNEVTFIGYKITDLLLHLEGQTVDLPIKGSKVFKDDNPLVIMTSNKNLTQLLYEKYRDEEKVAFYLPLFRARIIEVDCDNINLFELIDLLFSSSSLKK